ncbi:MAG: hypothetical protein Q8S03_05910 [Brevundimonas sp.]|uniref:hypothetical protein n=1 Tax=Brevundimonas sp. TaxID=1871086 RepID=UPI002732E5C0|nr:hypothetical protein [Brevundimonas sp.]MBX9616050.1 hypothetical protein [Caulobacteraceae bacterium]MDP3404207.1 hypothetical protein [Brevundimonas sp.]
MSPIQWALTFITYAVLCVLLWKGRAPERLAGIALLIAQMGTPLIAHITVNGFRVGVAALSLMLTTSLVLLALTGRRWWLIAAAGVQLIALASWGYQLIDPYAQIWGAVSFRMVVWMELMALAVFGLFEARMAPYARRGA